ncbi:MAG: hypothetical protein JWR84_805 [Caulobacter sp.]|nr:hypothetical protein [Caulobacter sp.]
MTSDPEHPEDGMAEDAKPFEDWEDAFIARNREAIGRMLAEARASLDRGEGREWNLEEFLEEARRRNPSAHSG